MSKKIASDEVPFTLFRSSLRGLMALDARMEKGGTSWWQVDVSNFSMAIWEDLVSCGFDAYLWVPASKDHRSQITIEEGNKVVANLRVVNFGRKGSASMEVDDGTPGRKFVLNIEYGSPDAPSVEYCKVGEGRSLAAQIPAIFYGEKSDTGNSTMWVSLSEVK